MDEDIRDSKGRFTKDSKCVFKSGEENKFWKGGLKKLYPKEYRLWAFIKSKCFNKKYSKYSYYGGRGITMFNEWIEDPVKFIDYIKLLPNYNKEDYTLDREDNDGNYEPCNLRWTSGHIQQTNKRISKNNKTGYNGTCFVANRYCSYLYIHSKCVNLGRFHTLKEAVEARNNYIIQNNLTEYKIQPFI